MVVTRRELEGLLSQLTREVADPREGLFGPRSVNWLVNRELFLLAGGGRAALLQLAHPYVAHAIEQHSPTKSDPAGRFMRTFSAVFKLVFGDVAATVDTARRVHAIHAQIVGEIREASARFELGHRYAANEPDALLWVFATLVETSVKTYSLLIRPLTHEERETYYQESCRFAMLFGLPREKIPSDWAAFRRYVDGVFDSDLLHVTSYARDIAHNLLDAPSPALRPIMAGYRVFTSGLLPHNLREAYGLPAGPAQQLAFWAEVRMARAAISRLPPRLRYFPAYIEAKRRLEGKGKDHVGRVVSKLAISKLLAKREGSAGEG